MAGGAVARFASLRKAFSKPHVFGKGQCKTSYLQRIVPSLRTSSRSPLGNLSPKLSSIHVVISAAALGVYLDMRSLRISASREDTDGMSTVARYACSARLVSSGCVMLRSPKKQKVSKHINR